MNTPSTIQIMVESFLNILKFLLTYKWDVVIGSTRAEEHIIHLIIVVALIRNCSLTTKLENGVFGATKVKNFRYIISENGVEPDPQKLKSES